MARGPVSLPGEAVDADESETDNVYATPLIEIMSNNSMVLRLARQFEILISKIERTATTSVTTSRIPRSSIPTTTQERN